jgi:MYXO-CTERM domain-containing protein
MDVCSGDDPEEKMRGRFVAALLGAAVTVAGAHDARAFCGFYVSGADAKLTNNATQVVMMRDGTRTVLSMQNNYQGPPQDFAMVIPVPVVLQKENVKTLTRAVFDRIDQLTAPRLVEYWEQDPCPVPRHVIAEGFGGGMALRGGAPAPAAAPMAAPPVKIEAQFSVGEYDVVVLSATDSTALDTWLRQNAYKIPAGAEPYLRPYVQMGMKFFVAKVNVSKVHFERVGNGPEQAILSPLRFHYDADAFSLPIRLGLINSGGTQDLVVTILARNQRYEVANYDNVAIPTNVDVSDATRERFGDFYATLFDQTLVKHPRSVVTEYSWQTTSCDPCPTPPLQPPELMTLGADVLPSLAPPAPPGGGAPIIAPPIPYGALTGFVVTRLHARYSKDSLGDDLFFRAAPPIVGGREFVQTEGKLELGARPDATNNFQARYAIRHPWTGPIACQNPRRGVWGAPPNGMDPGAKPAAKIGFIPRAGAVTLSSFVRGAVPPESFLSSGGPTPALAIASGASGIATAGGSAPAPAPTTALDVDASSGPRGESAPPPVPATAPPQGGCAGCAVGSTDASSAGAVAALVAIALTRLRRRRG